MSESTSLYRRHRPASFDAVVGQQHVVRTLSNAIEQDKVNHAYLFVGSRGTGKTSMAKILAASLNCERGGPTLHPCGECESCTSIAAGTSVDVVEMDAASNRSVDDIRSLRDRVAFAPSHGGWKVYILDEAHMLTKEAWNAFLKTLEEPPPNTVFILATTEAHKVMPTIADRCQRFDFQRPSVDQISEVLNRVSAAESISIDPGAVAMLARSASGSFRDALSTLDQLVSYSGETVHLDDVLDLLGAVDADLLFKVVDAVVAGDAKAVLLAVDEMAHTGRDPSRFARDLLGHLRVLLVTQTTGEMPETFAVTTGDPARLSAQAAAIGPATLIRTIDELADALTSIRGGDEARLAVEVALIKAAQPDLDPSSEGLMRRLERLERGVTPAPAAPATPPPAPQAAAPAPVTPPPAPAATAPDLPSEEEVDAELEAEAEEDEFQPIPVEPIAAAHHAINAEPAPAPADDAPEADPVPISAPDASSLPDDDFGHESAPPPDFAPHEVPSEASAPPSAPSPPPAPVTPVAPEAVAAPPAAAPVAPAPEPPAPPAAATEHDLERLDQVWTAVMDSLRTNAPGPTASYFEGTRPIRVEGDMVEVGFPADAAFNRRNAEKSDRREQLVAAILAVTGDRVKVTFGVLASRPDEPAPGPEPVDEEEFLNRVKTEFNAEEVI
mgnify:FL=1